MPVITTLYGPMDDATLLRHDTALDTDVETTTTVEYCLPDCDGAAHTTGIAQAEGCFCPHNIHRSVYMTLKKGMLADLFAGDLG